MKCVPTLATVVLVGFFASFTDQRVPIRARSANPGNAMSCSCANVEALTDRLRGVEAVLTELSTHERGPANRGTFDPDTFDQSIGEAILRAQMTGGGIGSLLIGDINRFSCEINTPSSSLSALPGAPAGLGASACLTESMTAQLNVRRQACLAAQNPSNQGTDYWEGRQMAEVLRELTGAYTAEADFIRQQLARLTTSCRSPAPGSGASIPPLPPPRATCRSCVEYFFEGERTFPYIGRIRMHAAEVIPFAVAPDNKVSGSATINTELDMSGSPCTVTGYNGVSDILINGEVIGGYLNVTITPKGSSQRTSAAIQITCPPGGEAHLLPRQQNYSLYESLKVPGPGQRYTEKRIDLSSRTMGAMRGYIVLRLFLSR